MPHELHSKLVLVFLLLYDGLRKKRQVLRSVFFLIPPSFSLSLSPPLRYYECNNSIFKVHV